MIEDPLLITRTIVANPVPIFFKINLIMIKASKIIGTGFATIVLVINKGSSIIYLII